MSAPKKLTLRFPERDIAMWAERYGDGDGAGDRRLLDEIRPAVLARGCLTRAEFLEVCLWKSPRSKPHCAKNSEHLVGTITRAALGTTDEALKMELLRLLRGVAWPTASAILHFCDPRPYPVLDVRAAWTVGFANPPHYTMDIWLAYLAFTRDLAARTGLSMRAVDKALWRYSKERQG